MVDPEKQFFRQINPKPEAHALPKRCLFLRGTRRRDLILDVGRKARSESGLEMLYENGASVWRRKAPAVAAPPED